MINKLIITLMGLLSVLLSSCYYDNVEDLYDEVIIPGEVGCEFTSVSYNDDLKDIINLYCNGACHNATDRQGNVILESYNQVMNYVNNGSFLGSINYESAYEPMPPGTKLNTCDIEKIKFWISEGAQNN